MPPDGAPFDRASLTKAASLNELVLPGGPYRGRSGAELLSRDAIAALAPDLDARRLSDELAVRPDRLAAVGAEVGRRVAALVSTLRQGPHAAPVPDRSPERVRALEEWVAIDNVILGGGLLRGALGAVVLDEARTHVAGIPPTRLSLAPWAPWLGLIGAARSCVEGEHLVVDGGQTSIKAAVAEVDGGALRRLRMLPATPFDGRGDVAGVLAGVLSDHRRWVSDEPVPCAIAAYVQDGRPTVFGDNAYERLVHAPSALLGRFRLLHDGAAAWRGTGRTSSSAVIVLGTWLGVGMGPQDRAGEPLRPLHPAFEVLPAGEVS